MENKKTISKEIQAINDKILNISILISAIFSLPTFISSIYRINSTGFNPVFLVQVFLGFLVILLYYLRNKLNFNTRLIAFLAFASVLIIMGMFTFGVLGFWALFIIFIVLMLSVFFKKTYGISFLVVSIILMSVASYLFQIRYLSFNFDIENYVYNYTSWINLIMGVIYISTMLLFPISLQRKYFISTINELVIAKEKAEKSDELQKAKDKIEESENKFRILFEKSNDASLLIYNQKFIDCNEATVKLLGYKNKEEMLNTHPSELSPEKQADGGLSFEKAEEMMDIALKKGENRFEWLHQKKNKEVFYVDVRLTVISIKGKTIIYTVWRDITDKKQAEIELQNKNIELIKAKEKAEESDRLKSAFLANMSHEIRAPLNGILGFADLLKDKDLNDKKKEKFLNVIDTSGNHLLDIINDIIDLSKIDAGQYTLYHEEIRLNNLFSELFNFFNSFIERSKNKNLKINLKKAFSDGSDTIFTDRTRLNQILTNLISNSIKFTNSGFINIEYSVKNDKELLFTVEDSGIGISKNEIDIVFKRFRQADDSETRRYGGTGLGLAISKSCVELLGGEIWVESEHGKGSKFSFTIPYKKTKNEA